MLHIHKNCIIKMIIRLFIISGLCKNVKELERLLVCEDRKLYGEMTEQPAKVLVILCDSNPSFSAIFMTNCELVVGKYGS